MSELTPSTLKYLEKINQIFWINDVEQCKRHLVSKVQETMDRLCGWYLIEKTDVKFDEDRRVFLVGCEHCYSITTYVGWKTTDYDILRGFVYYYMYKKHGIEFKTQTDICDKECAKIHKNIHTFDKKIASNLFFIHMLCLSTRIKLGKQIKKNVSPSNEKH